MDRTLLVLERRLDAVLAAPLDGLLAWRTASAAAIAAAAPPRSYCSPRPTMLLPSSVHESPTAVLGAELAAPMLRRARCGS